MQCPFIGHAASLPVESEPFWKGPVLRRGVTAGGLSILAGTLALGCPHLTMALHPPCLTDTRSWRFHHFGGLEVVSLPATGTQLPAGGRQALPPSAGDSHAAPGGWEPGRGGEKVEGTEIPVLALGAGTALGILRHHAVPASAVPRRAKRGSGTPATRTAGTHWCEN